MTTTLETINSSKQTVTEATVNSKIFIDELAEAIGWQSQWENINLDGVASNDHINIDRRTLPLRPNSAAFTWNEERYEPTLLNEARQIILYDLQNGGYGIDPLDEQALWQRARDRESQNANNSIQDFQRSIAARGFSVPQGAMLAGLQKVQEQSRGAISTINRDIGIKRADMYVQARQFAIQNGVNAEQFMVNYYAGYAERTLNSIRLMIEQTGTELRLWEAAQADTIKQADFYLNKWAKSTEAFLSLAKLELEEKRAISANESSITAEGISAAATALKLYQTIIEAGNNAASAIVTLSETQ